LLAFFLFAAPTWLSYTLVQKDRHFAQMEVFKGHPLVTEDLWNVIEKHQMWQDSAQHFSAVAASEIATNNIRVSILSFVLGISFGFGTVFVLVTNGLSIGTLLGLCKTYGLENRLWSFVAAHGVLELTAVFISGGAGLVLGKALLFPGRYRRVDALRLVATDAACLFAGCIPLLLLAGSIEGFVSPRTDLSPNIKYWISLATACFLVFYLLLPRKPSWSNDKNGQGL
jgi:uncharacterized membrane protein SpoIIM required for sporulation